MRENTPPKEVTGNRGRPKRRFRRPRSRDRPRGNIKHGQILHFDDRGCTRGRKLPAPLSSDNLPGQVVIPAIDDKNYPMVTGTEIQNVHPGKSETAVETEFRKVGFAICFDLNFTELHRDQHRLRSGASGPQLGKTAADKEKVRPGNRRFFPAQQDSKAPETQAAKRFQFSFQYCG